MEIEDLSEVYKIEKKSFSDPWKMESFVFELIQNERSHYFVMTHQDAIIGYGGCWFVEDEAEITTLAVDPAYRKKGIAKEILSYMTHFVYGQGALKLYLEVRVSNFIARKLYDQLGFKKLRMRRNYYPDREDAVVMGVNLNEKRATGSWY